MGVADEVDGCDPRISEPVVVLTELVVDVAHRVPLCHHDRRVELDGALLGRPQVQQRGGSAFERQRQMLAEHLDTELGEPLPHALFLEGEAEVLAEAVPVGHIGDLSTPLGRELGHGAAHEVVVVIHDEHAPAEFLVLDHDLLGRADVGERRIGASDRLMGGSVHAVSGPHRAGGEDHVLRAVVDNVRGGETARPHELHVVELVDLGLAPVDDPAPCAEARQRGHPAEVAAHALVVVDDVDCLVSAFAEHHRRFQTRRAGADHQDGSVAVRCRGVDLGVPSAPVFLAGGRVLGAPDRRPADLPSRHADVAPDALADVVEPALGDLVRQERIGDRRPRGADDVALAGRDGIDHHIGVGEAPDVDARLVGVLLGDAGIAGLVVGVEEA